MFLAPQIALMLAASSSIASAYQLTACTDGSCKENCVVINNPDVTETTSCNDFGFVAGSIEWYDTENTLNGFVKAREGCLGGPGDEDAWISSGDAAGNCHNLASSEYASEGIQYWMVNNNAR